MESSLAIFELDTTGKVLWANENFAKTMEYAVNEMPNLMHRQFCTESFAGSREYELFWKNLRNGNSFQEKIERVTKCGRQIWLEATYTPVRDENGRVTAVVKVATNIIEREDTTKEIASKLQHMAEELLQRAEQGIKRNEEMAEATEWLVEESKENMEILLSLKKTGFFDR